MQMFNLGESVWMAQKGLRPIQEPCPVCYGKKAVLVVLGNGDEVRIPCSFCGPSIDPPTGTITEYRIEPGAKAVAITGREIREGEVTEITYRLAGGFSCGPDLLFSTEAEALAASVDLCEEEKKKRTTLAVYLKAEKLKSFAWNAGYHLREAKRLKSQIEYHERMAILCKAKAGAEKGGNHADQKSE